MKVPLFNLKAQHEPIRRELDQALKGVLDSNQFILGSAVRVFETLAARFLGARYAAGVASGTDAILLSLVALGVGTGEEVITTPFTFFGTIGPILHLKAKPIFVDIDPRTYTLSPGLIKRKISKKTKVILPVHLYGQCANMTEIKNTAEEHQIPIVEDAAQAFGSLHRGKKAGTFGELGVFSFYPSKNLGACGDGGLVCSNRKDLVEKIKKLRVQGAGKKYTHEVAGFNSRLDSIQAALLEVKLKYIARWNQKRREKAEVYNQLLKTIREIEIPAVSNENTPIYHLYVIRARKRNHLIEFLTRRGIQTSIYYPLPLHLQKAVSGYAKGDFPESERAAREVLAIPLYPEITEQEQQWVASSIQDFYN